MSLPSQPKRPDPGDGQLQSAPLYPDHTPEASSSSSSSKTTTPSTRRRRRSSTRSITTTAAAPSAKRTRSRAALQPEPRVEASTSVPSNSQPVQQQPILSAPAIVTQITPAVQQPILQQPIPLAPTPVAATQVDSAAPQTHGGFNESQTEESQYQHQPYQDGLVRYQHQGDSGSDTDAAYELEEYFIQERDHLQQQDHSQQMSQGEMGEQTSSGNDPENRRRRRTPRTYRPRDNRQWRNHFLSRDPILYQDGSIVVPSVIADRPKPKSKGARKLRYKIRDPRALAEAQQRQQEQQKQQQEQQQKQQQEQQQEQQAEHDQNEQGDPKGAHQAAVNDAFESMLMTFYESQPQDPSGPTPFYTTKDPQWLLQPPSMEYPYLQERFPYERYRPQMDRIPTASARSLPEPLPNEWYVPQGAVKAEDLFSEEKYKYAMEMLKKVKVETDGLRMDVYYNRGFELASKRTLDRIRAKNLKGWEPVQEDESMTEIEDTPAPMTPSIADRNGDENNTSRAASASAPATSAAASETPLAPTSEASPAPTSEVPPAEAAAVAGEPAPTGGHLTPETSEPTPTVTEPTSTASESALATSEPTPATSESGAVTSEPTPTSGPIRTEETTDQLEGAVADKGMPLEDFYRVNTFLASLFSPKPPSMTEPTPLTPGACRILQTMLQNMEAKLLAMGCHRQRAELTKRLADVDLQNTAAEYQHLAKRKPKGDKTHLIKELQRRKGLIHDTPRPTLTSSTERKIQKELLGGYRCPYTNLRMCDMDEYVLGSSNYIQSQVDPSTPGASVPPSVSASASSSTMASPSNSAMASPSGSAIASTGSVSALGSETSDKRLPFVSNPLEIKEEMDPFYKAREYLEEKTRDTRKLAEMLAKEQFTAS